VTLCSPDHVSLLLHRTFNVSIPRHHIPVDQWEFEYGPAENDPEFGNVDDMDVDATEDVQEDDAQATTYQRGRWVHKITGDRLGGKDRWLHFTVVGLTVANQMLSLVGSIQPDPFSPEHIPQAKPDQAATQNTQPSPRLLSELAESEEMEERLEETMATREEEEETLATRGKKKREKEKVEKVKRKRKDDNAVAKSERKSKRKKTS